MDAISVTVISIAAFVAVVLLLKLYLEMRKGVCKSRRSMEGKTVIVTGANAGIGLETAKDLAKRKARVILACRSLERGEKAAADIRLSTGNDDVLLRQLDLSSLASVRNFAQEIKRTESRLDVLIHNAAIIPESGTHLTADNLELQFATNHFGPFLLNHLLLDLLKQSAPSRIVVVSSEAHKLAHLDLDKISCPGATTKQFGTYANTKLANLLFTQELHRRLAGTGVTVNALCPGAVATSILDNWWLGRYILYPLNYFFMKSAKDGAQTSIYLAVSEEVEGISGKYFRDCQLSKASSAAMDRELATRMWEVSEKITGICKDS